jgi:hypothetical protein
MFYSSYDIFKQDHLELPGIGHYRNRRESGQASQKRAGAVSSSADHHGGAQDDPIELALHKGLIAG